MLFAPSTGEEHLTASSALAAEAGLIYTGVPLLLPLPAQTATESPQPCVATCSIIAALLLLWIASNHYNKSGFLPVSAAGAFLAEHGLASLPLLSPENAWGHGLAESFLLGSTQGIPPSLGGANLKHSWRCWTSRCPYSHKNSSIPS